MVQPDAESQGVDQPRAHRLQGDVGASDRISPDEVTPPEKVGDHQGAVDQFLDASKAVYVKHPALGSQAESPLLDTPLEVPTGIVAERVQWKKDQQIVQEYLNKHAKEYLMTLVACAVETYCYPANVEGTHRTKKAVHKTLARAIGTLKFPVTMYTEEPDGAAMQRIVGIVHKYHQKYGITNADDEPTDRVGEQVFQQIYQYLMSRAWFSMDENLRKDGKEGIDDETMAAAMRINVMAARRMNVKGLEGKSVNEMKQAMSDIAQQERIPVNDTSSTRYKAIESAYAAIKSAFLFMPSNNISARITNAISKEARMGMYKLLPGMLLVEKVQGAIPYLNDFDNPVHLKESKEFMKHISQNTKDVLLIPKIVEAVRAGKTFEQFAEESLTDLERS